MGVREVGRHRERLTRVFESKDDEHQQRARNDLAEELARLCEEGLRVRAEDGGCGVRGRRDGAQVVALDKVDGGDVVCVDDARAHEAAEELRDQVHGEAPPGELAVQAVAEGDGGVEVCARVAGDVDA